MESSSMSEEEAVVGLWNALLARLGTDARVTGQLIGFLSLVKPVAVLGPNIYADVPNEITKSMIESRIMPLIAEHLENDNFSGASNLVLRINPELEVARVVDPVPASVTVQPTASPNFSSPPEIPGYLSQNQMDSRYSETKLNPRYTFDSFVIGGSNRFAHAAAFAVAEDPARAYNPLFIYGASGLGKTHLLHAIGHYTIALHPRRRVRYVSSEEFTNEFINAIGSNRAAEFQASYRDVDLLLIDDIQFLQRAEQTQEAFFQIFNTLYNNNKQVVITSDQPPRELGGFEERMVSRFAWGLMTDIQSPELETRIAILRKKADRENFNVSDEIIDYMAQRVSSNIRELEGTLIRVTAYANLNRQPVNMQLVQTVLRDLVPLGEDKTTTSTAIINEVAAFYGMTVDDLCGQTRKSAVAKARQIAMYICREQTDLSLPKIGELFGGRDHTTVLYAYRKVRDDLNRKRETYTHITEILGRIKNR
jgi:chromosomal replication initiator protein